MVFRLIVIDSSFLVSFYHSGDSNHANAIALARGALGEEKILSDVILFETLTVLGSRAGMECAKKALEELVSNASIRMFYFSEDERMEIINEFMVQSKCRLSAADISVIHLAKKSGSSILAFDKNLAREAKKN